MSKGRNPRETEVQEPSFQIRPSFEKKFRPGAVKDLIHQVLNDCLTGKYSVSTLKYSVLGLCFSL